MCCSIWRGVGWSGRSSRWEVGREMDVRPDVEGEAGWMTCTLLLVLTCLTAQRWVVVQRWRYSEEGFVVAFDGRDDFR